MSLLGREAVRGGGSLVELGGVVIPSILLHLVVLAFIITLPTFSFNGISYPSVCMVSLVSAPLEMPSKIRKEWITKEVGKIEPLEKKIGVKPLKKAVKRVPITPVKKRVAREKVLSKDISTEKIVSEAIERIKEEESSRKINKAVSRIKREVSKQGGTKALTPQAKGGVITSETTNLRFKIYYTIIWGKIKEGWILPEGLIRNQESLEAVISFKVLRDGKIEDVRFENSSGNSYFDKSVLRAVEKANPLPPLPGEYQGEHLDIGVRFHPSSDLLQ